VSCIVITSIYQDQVPRFRAERGEGCCDQRPQCPAVSFVVALSRLHPALLS
jgi:hypothetical protein